MSRSDIDAVNATFGQGLEKGDAALVASVYGAGARLLPPGMPAVSGPAIQEFWQGAMDSGMSGGSLETVRAAIRARLPLIALQSHITSTKVIPHWRVVTGYDDARQEVYLMDPLLGYVLMSYADFTRVWADHQGQFAVMYPPDWRKTVQKVIG